MMNCFCAHSSVILVLLFPELRHNLGNNYQRNLLKSAETVHDSSAYIILYKIYSHCHNVL